MHVLKNDYLPVVFVVVYQNVCVRLHSESSERTIFPYVRLFVRTTHRNSLDILWTTASFPDLYSCGFVHGHITAPYYLPLGPEICHGILN